MKRFFLVCGLLLAAGICVAQTPVVVTGSAPINGNVTSSQGNPATTANAWVFKLTDGTRIAAVKAASTGAQAADPALVVALSPNSVTPQIGDNASHFMPLGDSSLRSIHVTVDQQPTPAALVSGQQAVTATAAALAANAIKRVCVKAFKVNTAPVYVGPTGVTTTTGYELNGGESVCLDLNNTSLIFVVAASTGSSVSWTATN